jgi:hypothetical protein
MLMKAIWDPGLSAPRGKKRARRNRACEGRGDAGNPATSSKANDVVRSCKQRAGWLTSIDGVGECDCRSRSINPAGDCLAFASLKLTQKR